MAKMSTKTRYEQLRRAAGIALDDGLVSSEDSDVVRSIADTPWGRMTTVERSTVALVLGVRALEELGGADKLLEDRNRGNNRR